MVANRDTIQADFIAGEYRNKFFITDPNRHVADPKLFGIESFQPENQFNPERVTKRPKLYPLSNESGRQICSGR